jgi:hypothetical protein
MPAHQRSITVSAATACEYLEQYLRWYRDEYNRFVSPPPEGGGYPALSIGPFLDSPHIECWVADSGYAIAEMRQQPQSAWESPHSAGVAVWENIATDVADDVRAGLLPAPLESARGVVGETHITVHSLSLSLRALIERLTLGQWKSTFPAESTAFWHPVVIRNLGFKASDLNARRYFTYLEYSPHIEHAAWDFRTIPVRVRVDVRRDFAHAFAERFFPGGTIDFGSREREWAEHFVNALHKLTNALAQFQQLLDSRAEAEEREIHDYLKAHPELLDLYAVDVVSKPRFIYPLGETTKAYVEPDFIVKYPGQRYRLIELERPGKPLTTKQGHARREVTQAAYQIVEWETYIEDYPDRLQAAFPGIQASANRETTLIIGRDRVKSFGGDRRKLQSFKRSLRKQFGDVLTYDDLLVKCDAALARLSALAH